MIFLQSPLLSQNKVWSSFEELHQCTDMLCRDFTVDAPVITLCQKTRSNVTAWISVVCVQTPPLYQSGSWIRCKSLNKRAQEQVQHKQCMQFTSSTGTSPEILKFMDKMKKCEVHFILNKLIYWLKLIKRVRKATRNRKRGSGACGGRWSTMNSLSCQERNQR